MFFNCSYRATEFVLKHFECRYMSSESLTERSLSVLLHVFRYRYTSPSCSNSPKKLLFLHFSVGEKLHVAYKKYKIKRKCTFVSGGRGKYKKHFISWVENIRIFTRAAHSWKFWCFQLVFDQSAYPKTQSRLKPKAKHKTKLPTKRRIIPACEANNTCFVLNLTKHETDHAHKYPNINNYWHSYTYFHDEAQR